MHAGIYKVNLGYLIFLKAIETPDKHSSEREQ